MLESNPPRDSRSGYRRNVERGEGARSTLPTPLTPFRRFPPSLKKLKAKSCLESNPSCRIHAEPRQFRHPVTSIGEQYRVRPKPHHL